MDNASSDNTTKNQDNDFSIPTSAPRPKVPKRFKSAYMFFSKAKYSTFRDEQQRQGLSTRAVVLSKVMSQAWKSMAPADREPYTEMARLDKDRFARDVEQYKKECIRAGIPTTMKDPSAPKRPMSAFLAFSNARRTQLKRLHPDATNGDLSKILANQWKELGPGIKNHYIQEEKKLREKYTNDTARWKRQQKGETDKARAAGSGAAGSAGGKPATSAGSNTLVDHMFDPPPLRGIDGPHQQAHSPHTSSVQHHRNVEAVSDMLVRAAAANSGMSRSFSQPQPVTVGGLGTQRSQWPPLYALRQPGPLSFPPAVLGNPRTPAHTEPTAFLSIQEPLPEQQASPPLLSHHKWEEDSSSLPSSVSNVPIDDQDNGLSEMGEDAKPSALDE